MKSRGRIRNFKRHKIEDLIKWQNESWETIPSKRLWKHWQKVNDQLAIEQNACLKKAETNDQNLQCELDQLRRRKNTNTEKKRTELNKFVN
jgi:hypothetical protein